MDWLESAQVLLAFARKGPGHALFDRCFRFEKERHNGGWMIHDLCSI